MFQHSDLLIAGILFLAGLCLGAANDTLKYGSPESVGLLAEPLQLMEKNVSAYLHPAYYGVFSSYEVHPIQPGGVVLIGHQSTIVSEFAFGKASEYVDANGTQLPPDQQTAATIDTIYDMASLTKCFTAVIALRYIEDGTLDYTQPVSKYLPDFATNGKENVTMVMLFTHTSGFPPDPEPGLNDPMYTSVEQRRKAAIEYPLEDAPGSTYTYSDLNFINMGFILEAITNRTLDSLMRDLTTSLGMRSTFYNRGNVEGPVFPFYSRMAPQEFQMETNGAKAPTRPQPVHGTVHDPNAWALGGVSGHAGLFSTVRDVAKLCQMILNNGTYNGKRIYKKETIDLMFRVFNPGFPGDEHSIGFEINQYYFSGPLRTYNPIRKALVGRDANETFE